MFPVWVPPAAMRRRESLRQVTSPGPVSVKDREASSADLIWHDPWDGCWDWSKNVSRQPLLGKWHQQQGLFGSEESLELIKFPALKMTYSDVLFAFTSLQSSWYSTFFTARLPTKAGIWTDSDSFHSLCWLRQSLQNRWFLPSIEPRNTKVFCLTNIRWLNVSSSRRYFLFFSLQWVDVWNRKETQRTREWGREGGGAYPVSQPSRKSR